MGLRTGCFHGEHPTCDSGLVYYKVGKNEENGTSNLEFDGFDLEYKHILHYFHPKAVEEAEIKVRRIVVYSQPVQLGPPHSHGSWESVLGVRARDRAGSSGMRRVSGIKRAFVVIIEYHHGLLRVPQVFLWVSEAIF